MSTLKCQTYKVTHGRQSLHTHIEEWLQSRGHFKGKARKRGKMGGEKCLSDLWSEREFGEDKTSIKSYSLWILPLNLSLPYPPTCIFLTACPPPHLPLPFLFNAPFVVKIVWKQLYLFRLHPWDVCMIPHVTKLTTNLQIVCWVPGLLTLFCDDYPNLCQKPPNIPQTPRVNAHPFYHSKKHQ